MFAGSGATKWQAIICTSGVPLIRTDYIISPATMQHDENVHLEAY